MMNYSRLLLGKGIFSMALLLLFVLPMHSCGDDPKPDPELPDQPDTETLEPIAPVDIDVMAFCKSKKGFNLLGKFSADWSDEGFAEEEFELIKELGFNFARLAIDYRTYTKPGDWDTFIESEMEEIDAALAYGKKHGVHVCINLHRVPGYCVNDTDLPANQDLDLWTNTTAQAAFVNHWKTLARRYREVPYTDLSYNLVNEPKEVDEATYVNVMQKAIDAIFEMSPNRVVFIDGIDVANKLIMPLKGKTNIAQSIHVYQPFMLTHYKAGWVNGSDSWPEPVWPVTNMSSYLYGTSKSEFQTPLIIQGAFPAGTKLTVNVQQVSISSKMEVAVDDIVKYTKEFVCGAEKGDDWTKIVETEWGYQNISGKDYSYTLADDASEISISNTSGDWMTMNYVRLTNDQGLDVALYPGLTGWGSTQPTCLITEDGSVTDTEGNSMVGFGELGDQLALAESEGIPVMIQEFGVYNQTPHDITLSYMKDVVDLFKKQDVGYAIWNLTGSFGILDSDRSDVTYENYKGHQLDRALYEALK